jgi:hypothetical protein
MKNAYTLSMRRVNQQTAHLSHRRVAQPKNLVKPPQPPKIPQPEQTRQDKILQNGEC